MLREILICNKSNQIGSVLGIGLRLGSNSEPAPPNRDFKIGKKARAEKIFAAGIL